MMKRYPIYWTESERLAIREHCGCKARGRKIMRALGDGIVLAMLIAVVLLALYIETV